MTRGMVSVDDLLQAIHGYRETEKSEWKSENQQVLSRIRQLAFDDPSQTLVHVHVLDIAKDGYIKPHIDSIRVEDTIFHQRKSYSFLI